MDPKIKKKYDEAQYLYQQERWAEALVVLDDLSLSYKSDNEIMLNRAMCLARIGKEEEAELLCDHLTVVHKDARAAQLKAQIPQSRRDGKLAPKDEKKRKAFLSPEFVKKAIVVVSVLVLGSTGWVFFSNYKAPIPPTIATAPAPAGRTLSFPSDVSLGTVFVRDWGYTANTQGEHSGSWNKVGEAKGKVEIPAGKEAQLTFSPSQISNVSALRRLGSNALQSLVMNDCAIGDNDLSNISHMTGLFLLSLDNTQVGPQGFEKLYRLTSLREVSIIGTTLGEPGRAFIGNQTYLASIDADRADLGNDWLTNLPAMENLIFLSLDEIENITDDGIQHISKHPNLQKLFLSYTNLTDVGLKSLQTLKHLNRFWIEGTKVTDAGMAGFRTMPNIAEVGIAYTEVTTDGLMELSGIRTLKKVGIRGCKQISLDGARKFKRQNPDCDVETAMTL
tara:strand:+ start:110 stop:1453 length:1344 start_codon:yes stop_codon:yes gene_type:complete